MPNFPDVDDLHDLSHLESHVKASDVFLVIVTDKYLKSVNCRRELVEALRLHKPLVMVIECDPEKGATSVIGMKAELEALEREGPLSTAERDAAVKLIARLEVVLEGGGDDEAVPSVIEWHREQELRHVAYKAIIGNVLLQQPGRTRRMTGLSDVRIGMGGRTQEPASVVRALTSKKDDFPPPRSIQVAVTQRRLVKLCSAYKHVMLGTTGVTVYDDVASRLAEAGIEVHDEADADTDVPALLLLCPGVFQNATLVQHFHERHLR